MHYEEITILDDLMRVRGSWCAAMGGIRRGQFRDHLRTKARTIKWHRTTEAHRKRLDRCENDRHHVSILDKQEQDLPYVFRRLLYIHHLEPPGHYARVFYPPQTSLRAFGGRQPATNP